MAQRTIAHWEHCDSEEIHGTLHQIADQLAKAESGMTDNGGGDS